MADENRLRRLAILIDADNTSPRVADGLFEEIAKFGEASVRRIYGDFSSPRLKSWIEILQKHAIDPYQQFAYTSGKNASDIALVIDAMDLLHTGRFDGFCLVSSDSDFTRLASRIVRDLGRVLKKLGLRDSRDATLTTVKVAFRQANTPQQRRYCDVLLPKESNRLFCGETRGGRQNLPGRFLGHLDAPAANAWPDLAADWLAKARCKYGGTFGLGKQQFDHRKQAKFLITTQPLGRSSGLKRRCGAICLQAA